MCYRPPQFMSPEAASNLDDLGKLGWLTGEDSAFVIGVVDGVELRRHPEILLAENPELWVLVDQFSSGARRKVDVASYDTLSNFAFVAIRTMAAAHGRETARDIEETARASND